ncbi:hypothetical protein Ctob_001464 [Chrysochromulina tobinii]|uniref:RanBP2-type domain-containing protein n=1 Tax=Chrysochromulina tobinii TaxID=1460289 RepID=A0A0M0JN47_9EUKA|nr:hypothetical protein Ctob_001464 [Chrysochromulina tobinii]|eukprot:KOO27986.1 hypothetical protein Ctob_001464 [Chrysochromulina sp. CCMP291]
MTTTVTWSRRMELQHLQRCQAYQRARAASVKRCAFDLRSLSSGSINTGRTIKPLASWSGLWPPLREFLQNTIDHLELFSAGDLHPALTLEVRDGAQDGAGGSATTIAFVCDAEDVCVLRVRADELVIEQHHTYALHPRALDTGVIDTTKGGDKTAGGFGDGFKTALVSLLALPHGACRALAWDFFCGGRHVRWAFAGAQREAVGNFARSTVLEVTITNEAQADAECAGIVALHHARQRLKSIPHAVRHEVVPTPCVRGDNFMVQTYRVDGIGAAFLSDVITRFQVFWSVPRSQTLCIARGDFLACAEELPPVLPAATLGGTGGGSCEAVKKQSQHMPWDCSNCTYKNVASARHCEMCDAPRPGGGPPPEPVIETAGSSSRLRHPQPGIYIRGIWVRKPQLEGSVMSFLGSMNVSGRDRNDVDHEELVEATLHVLRATTHSALRLRLLEPLRQPRLPDTWLTRSSPFLNQLLEKAREFFLCDVFSVPRDALFVSTRTTDSMDQFIRWASAFLARRGAPLLPLEPNANKHLFHEVSEAELKDRCVQELLRDAEQNVEPQAKRLQSAFDKLLRACEVSKLTVHFGGEIVVAFMHGNHAFVPLQPLSRRLILLVLSVVQRKVGVYEEAFTHMTQAIFETMAADEAVDEAQLDAAISRAKIVQREAAAFLGGQKNEIEAQQKAEQERALKEAEAAKLLRAKRKAAMEPAAVTDLTSDVDEAPPPPDAAGGGKRRGVGGGGGGGGGGAGSSSSGNAVLGDQQAQLADQIAQVNRLRGVIGHNEVLPASAFFNDDGSSLTADGCVQCHSTLVPTAVCEGAGGGRLHADRGSASYLLSMPPDAQAALRGIREALNRAKRLVARALPSVQRLLAEVVCEGYDVANTGYLGFCTQRQIIINLCPLLQRALGAQLGARPRASGASAAGARLPGLPVDLAHEMLLTLLHELAHMLERGGDDGVALCCKCCDAE